MKKYMVIALCIISTVNGMEKLITIRKPIREPREWDAEMYDAGNDFQKNAFLYFLQTNNIPTNKLNILSVGCGTGKIENILAEKATHIHGFDASNNMIIFAKNQFKNVKNLSFQHCFAEDFQSPKHYQLALASFCIHWFEDKKQAFQRINDSLEIGGEFFGTVHTSNNPTPLNLVAARESIETIQSAFNWLTGKDLIDLTGSSYPSNDELDIMLKDAGFEILKREEQSFECPMTKEEIVLVERPIVFSRPIMKWIPNMLVEGFFNDYIDLYISKLPKLDNGKFLENIITTIVHARKIKK